MLNQWLDAARNAPLPAQIAAGILALAVLALAYLVVARLVRAGYRVLTAGLAQAKKADDPATAVLGWINRYIFFTIGGIAFLSSGYGVFHALTGQANAPTLVGVFVTICFDGLAVAFVANLYYQARTGGNRTPPRLASWLMGSVSAAVNFTHPIGGVEFLGLLPLVGLLAIEWQAGWEWRQARRNQQDMSRSLLAAFYARQRANLAAWLGVDTGARDTDTEQTLKVRKAGRLLYALQVADAPFQDKDAKPGRFARWRVSRLEVRARKAQADAGVDLDPATDRAVLRHMRMLAGTRIKARDNPPAYEPYVADLTAAYEPAYANGPDSRTADTHVRGMTSDDERTQSRTNPRTGGVRESGNRRTQPRTNRRTQSRTDGVRTPDVSDLIETGQVVYADLHADGVHLTRDRLAGEMRTRGYPVGQARAAQLWRELNNGHAPALD